MDAVWERTQRPEQHARWDLRFSTIEPTGEDGAGRLTFRYTRRVGPLVLTGTGTHSGERRREGGSGTSALRWTSDHALSLVGPGSGYWRYLPLDDGTVRFLTGYDYRPGWGRAGDVVDRLVFRRALWWATAWSFDRLRIWLEHGVPPESARTRAVLDVGGRAAGTAAVVMLSRRLPGRQRVVLVLVALTCAVLAPARDDVPRARRCRRRPGGGSG